MPRVSVTPPEDTDTCLSLSIGLYIYPFEWHRVGAPPPLQLELDLPDPFPRSSSSFLEFWCSLKTHTDRLSYVERGLGKRVPQFARD